MQRRDKPTKTAANQKQPTANQKLLVANDKKASADLKKSASRAPVKGHTRAAEAKPQKDKKHAAPGKRVKLAATR